MFCRPAGKRSIGCLFHIPVLSCGKECEQKAVFLSGLIREKANEQSPQALLVCISINHFSAIYAQSTAEGILNRFYFAASNSASISAEGAGVTRLTTTQTISEIRNAGSSS